MYGRVVALGVLVGAACHTDLATNDDAFYAWDDRQVHCAIEIDAVSGNSLASIERGLDRARDRGEVLELLVHTPGKSLGWHELEAVLDAAASRGLPFLTFHQLADPASATAGVALQYDDWSVEAWAASRDLLGRYGAKVTMFVARYAYLTADQRTLLAALAADGNEIEAHGVAHLRGPDYVEQHGLDAYLTDEVLPSIQRLRADGYPIDSFAYPFGVRTDETDRAILERGQLRAVRGLARSTGIHGSCRD